MAYLNLDLDYFDHPKSVRLVGLLGKGSDLLPIRLWCYCGKYHADTGILTGFLPQEIETALRWWGPAGRAVEALEKTGFLERCENGYKVHDWEEINGHISALKERASVAARARWDRVRQEAADAQALLTHSPSNAPGNAPSSPSIPKEENPGWSPGGVVGMKPKGKKPKPDFPEDSDPMRLARFFAKFHADWAVGAKPPDPSAFQRWAGVFDAMTRIDGRSVEQVGAMLNAIDLEKPAKGSDFLWRKNILSAKTLRDRWNEGKLGKFLEVPEHGR